MQHLLGPDFCKAVADARKVKAHACTVKAYNANAFFLVAPVIKMGNSIDIATQTAGEAMVTSSEMYQHIDNLERDIMRGGNQIREFLLGTVALVSDVFTYAEALRTELDAVKAELQALRAPVAVDGAEEAVAPTVQ